MSSRCSSSTISCVLPPGWCDDDDSCWRVPRSDAPPLLLDAEDERGGAAAGAPPKLLPLPLAWKLPLPLPPPLPPLLPLSLPL